MGAGASGHDPTHARIRGEVDDGLDSEKLQALGDWAERLRGDPRPELAAAGRAIQLLLAEIERLRFRVSIGAPPSGGTDLAGIWARRQEQEDH